MRSFCLRLARIDSCENKHAEITTPVTAINTTVSVVLALGVSHICTVLLSRSPLSKRRFTTWPVASLVPRNGELHNAEITVIRVFCRIASIRPYMKASERKSLKFMIYSEKLATHHLYVYAYA